MKVRVTKKFASDYDFHGEVEALADDLFKDGVDKLIDMIESYKGDKKSMKQELTDIQSLFGRIIRMYSPELLILQDPSKDIPYGSIKMTMTMSLRYDELLSYISKVDSGLAIIDGNHIVIYPELPALVLNRPKLIDQLGRKGMSTLFERIQELSDLKLFKDNADASRVATTLYK